MRHDSKYDKKYMTRESAKRHQTRSKFENVGHKTREHVGHKMSEVIDEGT